MPNNRSSTGIVSSVRLNLSDFAKLHRYFQTGQHVRLTRSRTVALSISLLARLLDRIGELPEMSDHTAYLAKHDLDFSDKFEQIKEKLKTSPPLDFSLNLDDDAQPDPTVLAALAKQGGGQIK